jgi:hypothetical protein
VTVLRSGKHWKPKPIGFQVGAMRELFPQFKYHRSSNSWVGCLQPSSKSPQYKIRVQFRVGFSPHVYVLEPAIASDAPHVYRSDNSLCLYYPDDGSWSSEMLIAKTIIPWTSEWLRFYEIWCVTGRWFGAEAPHRPRK